MANNKVILTAGEAIKKEGPVSANIGPTGRVFPGTFVMRTADGYLPADGTAKEVAIVDYSSVNGMERGVDVFYQAGDQIPVLYPQVAAEVNVLLDTTLPRLITPGTEMIISSTGMVEPLNPGTGGNVIGRAVESIQADANEIRFVKIECLAVPYFRPGIPSNLIGFAPFEDTIDGGTTADPVFDDKDEVIAALPTWVWGLVDGGAVVIPIASWADTDTYNKAVAGSYTFTATLGNLPSGITNTNNLGVTVEVVIGTPA